MKIQKLIFYILMILVSGITYLVFISSIPENPLTPRNSIKSVVNLVSPQGWNFFTRSPKESTFDIYKADNNKLRKINLENSCYTLGVSRKGRLVSIQLITIINSNKKLKWNDFNGDLHQSLSLFSEAQKIKNVAEKRYIPNGNYLIVENIVLPWVWVKKAKNYKKKYKIAYVTIES